jgi:hypothetical protein
VTTRRHLLALGLLPAAPWARAANPPAPAAMPAVLREPALITPRAAGAAMLAVARAGRRLVAAGERGIVRVSDDDGATWSQARVPVQVSLAALHFADARRGWAAGHLGVILRTDDGGATWTRQLDGIDVARQVLAAAPDEAARQRAQRLVDEGPDKPFFDLDLAGPGGCRTRRACTSTPRAGSASSSSSPASRACCCDRPTAATASSRWPRPTRAASSACSPRAPAA